MKKTAWRPVLSFAIAILLAVAMCWLSMAGQARLPALTARQLLNRQGAWVSDKEFLQLAAIDLNTADAVQLQEVPGIGPVLSQRIVDYRDTHGYLTDIDQLDDVKGIGEKTLRALDERGYIVPVNADK